MTKYLYLGLCVLGAALPYSQFLIFIGEQGLNVPLFFEQLFANRVSSFFGLDVIICTFVVWVFVVTEGRKQRMNHLWVYIACAFLVGVSLALPLFLYARERKRAERRACANGW